MRPEKVATASTRCTRTADPNDERKTPLIRFARRFLTPILLSSVPTVFSRRRGQSKRLLGAVDDDGDIIFYRDKRGNEAVQSSRQKKTYSCKRCSQESAARSKPLSDVASEKCWQAFAGVVAKQDPSEYVTGYLGLRRSSEANAD
ncbi:hypothetical protein GGX14DRAFT_394525 [Mycena pura]|uniref:Uncharacterized protein n=1 Tax=Mycena pura TaxID=153505 RepID=A0AAD6VF49_9AGAR|nr:hypothetical protein GGX14DRAFT_394525 [Mycena pura]